MSLLIVNTGLNKAPAGLLRGFAKLTSIVMSKPGQGDLQAPFHTRPPKSSYLVKQIFHKIYFRIPERIYFILEELTARETW
jgi:hypothetical protein